MPNPSSQDHIVSSYTDELTALAQLIAEMGGQVEVAIENGTKALLKLDRELADVTIIADQRVDDMQRRIDDMAVSMIARRQPMASDLRAISPRSTSLPIWSASATWPSSWPAAR